MGKTTWFMYPWCLGCGVPLLPFFPPSPQCPKGCGLCSGSSVHWSTTPVCLRMNCLWGPYPVNTKHLYNFCTMLDQRRRCFVFAGLIPALKSQGIIARFWFHVGLMSKIPVRRQSGFGPMCHIWRRWWYYMEQERIMGKTIIRNKT